MTTKNTVAGEVKGLGIVALIMKALKLDEEGKIGKFFAKEVKKFENAIRDLKNNIAATENVHQSNLERLNDGLEDAKEGVETAYQNVTVENVANNATMESFASTYWYGVETANSKVKSIENKIKDATEAHVKAIEEITLQIAKYQARIDKINA